ncbi:MAG: alpha/beta fold hydrolase [Chloroflexota bacterium]
MKISGRIFLSTILLTFFLISSCQSEEPIPSQQIEEVAAAPTEPVPTLIPTVEVATIEPSTLTPIPTPIPTITPVPTSTPLPTATPTPTHPLMVELMRQREYPGSALTFVEQLDAGANFDRYIVSYESDGHTIFAVLNVPWGEPPATGWPVIIFNHGFIRPDQYVITQYYDSYMGVFSSNGYIVINSDYRGHGESEGEPIIIYRDPGYVTDVLNALAAVKTYELADPNRVGMYGHSMGGFIALRSMIISEEIKAGVLWGGVVANFDSIMNEWVMEDSERFEEIRTEWRNDWYGQYGSPEENPEFWRAISSNSYLTDLSGPLQIHHATGDAVVPVAFSQTLQAEMEAAGMPSELFLYQGDDHNIAGNFWTAMQRSVAFFDQHVKAVGS